MHEIYHGIGVRVNSICDEMLGGVSDEPALRTRRCRPLDHRTALPDVLAAIPLTSRLSMQRGQNSA
jgi:hypothetical protein